MGRDGAKRTIKNGAQVNKFAGFARSVQVCGKVPQNPMDKFKICRQKISTFFKMCRKAEDRKNAGMNSPRVAAIPKNLPELILSRRF
jgi:hypothetical protein